MNTDTTVTTVTTTEVVTPKAPSKKSLALQIFQTKLAEREASLFSSNKEFRSAVLTQIQNDLGVSIASAATMYNAVKKEAEAAGVVTLGRDPKKARVKTGSGKRGRPAGSKNRPKVEVVSPVVIETVETTVSTEVVA